MNKIQEFIAKTQEKPIILNGFIVKSLKNIEKIIEEISKMLGNIDVRKIVVKGAITTVVIGSLLLNTGCSVSKDIPMAEIIQLVGQESSIDEVLKEDEELLDKVCQTEKCLELSKKLHGMNIDHITTTDLNSNIDYLAIEELIDVYESGNKEIGTKLSQDEAEVNSYLLYSGYSNAEKFALTLIKSKIADALNIDIQDIDNIEIGENYNIVVNETSFEINDTVLHNCIDDLYSVQRCSNNMYQSSSEYNNERNRVIKELLESTKKVATQKYTIDGTKIVSNGKIDIQELTK